MGVHHQKTWDPKWGLDHQQGFRRIEWRYHDTVSHNQTWQNPSRMWHWNGKITHVPFSVVEAKGKGCWWFFFSGGEEPHGFGIFVRKTVKGQSITSIFETNISRVSSSILSIHAHPIKVSWTLITSSHQGIIPFPFDPRLFLGITGHGFRSQKTWATVMAISSVPMLIVKPQYIYIYMYRYSLPYYRYTIYHDIDMSWYVYQLI